MSLRNSKIVHKILLLLGLMAALSAGLTINALVRMGEVDQDYSNLLEQEAKAVVWLARSTSTLNETGRLLYTMIAESDDGRMRALGERVAQQETLLKERLDLVIKAFPRVAPDVEAAKRSADALSAVARDVGRLTLAHDDEAAMRMARERYEPTFADLLTKLRSLIDSGDRDLKAASDRTTQSYLSARFWTLVIAAGGMSLCIGLAVLLARRTITGPIERLTSTMRQLAAGDVGVSVGDQDRGDEIGGMAQAVQIFKDAAIAKRSMEEAERAALAKQAVRQQHIEESTRRFDGIVGELLTRVTGSVQALHTASDGLAANAEETQRQSATVSSSAAQATANVETVAAAGTELNASINEIARQVTEGSQIAIAAENDVSAADAKVANLAEAVSRIGEVTTLISGIAAQTNLLALNATIEAARAGDAGKGFAVVASEVKNLANQTARATDEIAGQIAAIQSGTTAAVEAIRGISQTILRVRQLTTTIAGAVEEQGAATAEIVRNVDEAAQGTRSVAETITDVAQAATQTGEMASTVFRTASEVQQESEALRREIERYLEDVHAA